MTVSWTNTDELPPGIDLGEDDGGGGEPEAFGVLAAIVNPYGESCGSRVQLHARAVTPGTLAAALQAVGAGAAHAFSREVGDQYEMRTQDPDTAPSTHHPHGAAAGSSRLTVAVLDDLARQYVANTPNANLDLWTLQINGMRVSYRATRHVLAAAQAWK